MADRQFLFEYSHGMSTWGVTIHARDEAEAKKKIKAMTGAKYRGEVHAMIPVPCGSLLARLIAWLKS